MSTTSMIDMVARRSTASHRIEAPAELIFNMLADPAQHASFDGSGMIGEPTGTTVERLKLGSKFNMSMTLKMLPYRIGNTVVEFDENRLIAWQHLGKHRWRYELEEVEGATLVTETFDWSTSVSPKAIELVRWPKRNLSSIEKTLERLAEVAEKAAIAAS